MSGLHVWNRGDSCTWGYEPKQDRIPTHLHIIAQRDPSENLGTDANHYAVARFGPGRQAVDHVDLPCPKVTPLHPSQLLMRQALFLKYGDRIYRDQWRIWGRSQSVR
jgi:hypothetical protein